ncbi:MAG: Crp/Fnr family transcriptional regulator [Bdellovibrionales bacterium]|nr:Crp/Fnr family transcriptional regulator [Bdellovibrionales bacterium]
MDKQIVLQAALKELLNFQIFSRCTLKDLAEICANGEVVVSQHRDILYQMGEVADSFGIVLSGAYKLTRSSPNGDDTIVHFCTPGDVIAAFIMSQERPIYPVSSFAMGPSRFLKIPKETYLRKWKERPDLIFNIQSLLSTRIGNMQMQLSLTKAPLSVKIAHLLVDMLNRFEDHGSALKLPLTRKEIADNLGSSVESVIRIMSDWTKKGIIETQDQQIKILKLEKVIAELEVIPSVK